MCPIPSSISTSQISMCCDGISVALKCWNRYGKKMAPKKKKKKAPRVHVERRHAVGSRNLAGGASRVWRVSRGVVRRTWGSRLYGLPGGSGLLCQDLPGRRGCGRAPTFCPGSCLALGRLLSSLCACTYPPRPVWGAWCGRRSRRAGCGGARRGKAWPPAWALRSAVKSERLVDGPSRQTWGCRPPGTPLTRGPASCAGPLRWHQPLVANTGSQLVDVLRGSGLAVSTQRRGSAVILRVDPRAAVARSLRSARPACATRWRPCLVATWKPAATLSWSCWGTACPWWRRGRWWGWRWRVQSTTSFRRRPRPTRTSLSLWGLLLEFLAGRHLDLVDVLGQAVGEAPHLYV